MEFRKSTHIHTILNQFGDMGLSKNVFYSKYLLLFAILMEEIMINHSILPLHFQTNSVLCGFRLHLEDSEAPLQGCMFFGRDMTRQIAVPIEYTYTYVLYIQYIYRQHAAHAPSSCTSPQSLFHIQLWNPQTLVWTCIFLKNLSMTIYICIHVYIYIYI